MNLFVLDRNPRLAARAHCDKHVVKMVLETAQLLRACADQPDALTPFALAMPEAYRSPDPVASYRAYYRADKSAIAEYRMGDKPEWMTHASEVSL